MFVRLYFRKEDGVIQIFQILSTTCGIQPYQRQLLRVGPEVRLVGVSACVVRWACEFSRCEQVIYLYKGTFNFDCQKIVSMWTCPICDQKVDLTLVALKTKTSTCYMKHHNKIYKQRQKWTFVVTILHFADCRWFWTREVFLCKNQFILQNSPGAGNANRVRTCLPDSPNCASNSWIRINLWPSKRR